MEEITEEEFDFEFPTIPEVKYSAVFDKDTGKIVSIGPSYGVAGENIIDIEKELAEDILTGTVNIHDCFLDFYENKVEVKQVLTLYKIDDVLHRIVEKQYSDAVHPDISVRYNKKQITIELSDRFYGTLKSSKNVKKQKVIWSGDTELIFYITDYNDPHVIHDIISITLDNITEKKYTKKIKLPEKFSIFTRRLFKKYVMEIK